MPQSLPHDKRFESNELSLFFTVGPAGADNDELAASRQTKSFAALEALLNERGMDEFGVPDSTVSEDFRFVPFELCANEWDSTEVDGKTVYSVTFFSNRPFDQVTASKLRFFVAKAYASVCGADARFVKAELFQKWVVTERGPFVIEN
ncbi:hypothetical protein P5X00_36365 [Paraburkholderia sp. A2RO-4L]|uniref:hypothetical protein n=1 Tax=Paraburkholderia sp. A2RO-4L TaxID=3028374 RepID=UPI0032F46885|nr:hypothetical protein [Burkholderia vietnamiensis]